MKQEEVFTILEMTDDIGKFLQTIREDITESLKNKSYKSDKYNKLVNYHYYSLLFSVYFIFTQNKDLASRINYDMDMELLQEKIEKLTINK